MNWADLMNGMNSMKQMAVRNKQYHKLYLTIEVKLADELAGKLVDELADKLAGVDLASWDCYAIQAIVCIMAYTYIYYTTKLDSHGIHKCIVMAYWIKEKKCPHSCAWGNPISCSAPSPTCYPFRIFPLFQTYIAHWQKPGVLPSSEPRQVLS